MQQVPFTCFVRSCVCPTGVCVSVTERAPTCRANTGYDPYNSAGRPDVWRRERTKTDRTQKLRVIK